MGDTKTIELQYLNSNVIDEKETKERIKNTLNQIANEVSMSLGPYGSTTIIEKSDKHHYMTKDGYTILKAMKYNYEISRTILDIVKTVSKSLVRTVGDGSTSAVIVANQLFNSINKISDATKLAPQDILEIFTVLSEIFEKYIRQSATQITEENFEESIKRIASISCNNSKECGDLFYEIFNEIGKYGFINLENSKSSKDYFTKVQGIEVPRGWINARMATMNDKVSYEYENPYIFMINDMLTDDEQDWLVSIMETVCIKQNTPLIIIAQSYSTSMKAFFDNNLQKNRGHLPLVAIDIDCSSKKGKERFDDLALALNCKYFDKFNGMEDINDWTINDLGRCKIVKGDDLKTIFIDGVGYEHNHEGIEERIKELQEEYERVFHMDEVNDNREQDLFNIKKRIATLTCSMATLYVGGSSEIEKETRKFLMEDAVYACRSSIENGYIVGGNLIIPKIIYRHLLDIIEDASNDPRLQYLNNIYNNDNDKLFNVLDIIINEINNAFAISFKTVLRNAHLSKSEIENIYNECIEDDKIYNIKIRKFEDDKETNVINSAETDIEIIKASFSIIGLLATSNQFISSNPISSR